MESINDVFEKETELPGYWWFKEDEDLKIPGTLSYSPVKGINLDLIGNLPEEKLINPYGITLFGESTFGKKITIHQLFRTQLHRPISEPHGGVSSYVANKAYVGAHILDPKDAILSKIKYYPTFLERWLRLKTLDYDFNKSGFQVAFNHPKSISFDLTDDLSFRLEITAKGPGISAYDQEIRFEYKPFVSLDCQNPIRWNEFGSLVVILNNFFSLPLMEPVYPLYVEGVVKASACKNNSESQVVRILLPLNESPISEGPHYFEMLYTYEDVKEDFPKHLSNWFLKEELLGPIYDLFFASYSSNQPYLVTMFLNYVQALETYHLRTQSDNIDPLELHRKRMKEILDSVPDEYRDWVARKLGFSNRKTLAQRLKDLIDINPNVVTGRAGDHDTFIERVKDSRNYYTHYDPSMESKAETGGYLKGLSITLGLMIEGFLLQEVGFELSEVQKMQRSRRRLPPSWY